MKQITFKQYKAIDIAIMSALLFVFEVIAILVFKSEPFFVRIQDYNYQGSDGVVVENGVALLPLTLSISLTLLIMLVVMMRWSEFAFIPAIVGGVAYCVGAGEGYETYIIYCLGNLLGLLTLLIIRKIGKEEVRAKISNLILIAVSTYVFMAVGRWLVSLIFTFSILTLPGYFSIDLVSLIVAIVGLIALRKSDGMLEDQKSYLLRLDREKKAEAEKRTLDAAKGYYGMMDDDEYDAEYDDFNEESDAEYDDEYITEDSESDYESETESTDSECNDEYDECGEEPSAEYSDENTGDEDLHPQNEINDELI